jgi:hypothetical protein
LGELLVDAAKFDDVVHRIPVNPSKGLSKRNYAVDVIPAGRRPPNPADLIESQQMRRLLAQASATYDLVVIDTPPTTIVSDAVPLLKHVTGVLVVVRLGKSTRKAAESLQQQLEYLDAPALGVVLNATGKTMEPYGYGYLEDDAEEEEEARPEPEADTEEPDRNWVYNRLTVTGESEDLNDFVERAEGDVDDDTGEPVALDFAQHSRRRRLGFGRRNGASSNGWHAKSPERKGEADEGEVVYVFASAPSPPEDWLERVSEAHPELSFSLEFIEEFCEEAAGARWRGGTVVETWEIDPQDAEWVEFADDGKG